MYKPNNIDWSKYLSVNTDKMKSLIICHYNLNTTKKLTTRIFTLKCSGTQYETTAFLKFVANSIPNYVFDLIELKRMEEEGDQPYREALTFFGDKHPLYQGKYGELILYLFIETILGIPLVAHKLKIITNPRDEIKGGDGIFYGLYKDLPAIVIGESKVWKIFESALKDAFDSLDRFHNEFSKATSSFEFQLARRNLSNDLSIEDLNLLYNSFTPGKEEYRNSIKVHPVLIMYDEKSIKSIDALNSEDFEKKLKVIIDNAVKENEASISEMAIKYPKVNQVYLDFFMLPLEDVGAFKYSLFEAMTGTHWKDISDKKVKKEKGKEKRHS